MTKLSNILKDLNSDELEELIEKAQHKTNELKAEKKVKLIVVSDGIVSKWFELKDVDAAISFARKRFDELLESSKRNGCINSEISINTCLIPEHQIDKLLGEGK